MEPVTSYKPVVMWMDDDYHPDSFQTRVEYGSRRDVEMKCVLYKYAGIIVYLDLEKKLDHRKMLFVLLKCHLNRVITEFSPKRVTFTLKKKIVASIY